MTVLVAYAPDDAGDAALARGIHEARLRDARMVVVNGSKSDRMVDPWSTGVRTWEQVEQQVRESGLPHEMRRVEGADVAQLVLDAATEVGADLLVIGLRRRSPIGKLILGSVAQQVLLASPCAVLSVRPDAVSPA